MAEPITDVSASLVFRDGFSRHFDVELFPEQGLGHAAPTPKPVREMLQRLAFLGVLSPAVRREAGRALAVGPYEDARERLDAFAAMGLGKLLLHETRDGQRIFVGESLLDGHLHGAGGCDVALGFCEGTVAQLTGRGALGAETACQRKGAPRCTFVVRER